MVAHLLVLGLLLAQDAPPAAEKVRLAWRFEKGRSLRMDWTMSVRQTARVEGSPERAQNFHLNLGGRFDVAEVRDDGTAEAKLTLADIVIEGPGLKAVAKEGKVVELEGVPDGGAGIEQMLATPVELTFSPTGEYKLRNEIEVVRMFGGQGTLFGPRLPAEPVAAGAEWPERLRSPQAARQGGPSFEVLRKLEAVEKGGAARIVTDTEAEMEHMGIKFRMRFTGEDRFDSARGRLIRSTGGVEGTGEGNVQGRAATMTFSSSIALEVSDPR